MKDNFVIEKHVLKLRELLRKRNLTYADVAQKIGKRRETIVNYLNNKTKLPFEDFILILNALDVSPCYFFDCGGTDNSLKQQISNSGIVAGSNVEIKQMVNHSHELEIENEKLKAELEGCRKLLEEKDKLVDTLKQMIEMIKNK